MCRYLTGLLIIMLPSAHAAVTMTLQLGSFEWPGITASNVEARLAWDEADRMRLTLTAGEVALDERRYADLRLDCKEADWTEEHLSCRRGALAVAGKREPLVADVDVAYEFATRTVRVDSREARIAGGRAVIQFAGSGGNWKGRFSASKVELPQLQSLLQAFGLQLQGYSDVAGRMDIGADLRFDDGNITRADLRASGEGVSFAGAAISDNANLEIETQITREAGALLIAGEASLSAGAVYFEPGFRLSEYKPGITLEVSGQPIALRWDARVDPAFASAKLNNVHVNHPGVVSMSLSGSLPASSGAAEPLRMEFQVADLQQLYQAHLQSHCAHLPVLCGLEFAGTLDGTVTWAGSDVSNLNLEFGDVYLDDERGRFRISALNGDLILHDGAETIASALAWQNAGWQRLTFGAGSMGMSSRARSLEVTRWSDVEVLGGTFKIAKLALAGVGTEEFSVSMQGVLTPISMQNFTQAMGWPIMSGTLSGQIPGIRFEGKRLAIDGDLIVSVFDGTVTVSDLIIDDMFGPVPILTTDVDVRGIDLEQLTGAFSFGKIEGSLEGKVEDLRLENWEPTAFDGWLITPDDDDRSHRISQKAVDNLSTIGGGGIAGALSRGFLQIFKDYSYGRLGLYCRLEDGICAMKGVAPADDGFYIVTRGGLLPPWIDVKGSGRPLPDGRFGVAWDDILLGLKRINSGQMKLQR